MTLTRDEDATLRANELARLREPDVGEQRGDPLSAGQWPHVVGERLGTFERRPPRTGAVAAWRDEHA